MDEIRAPSATQRPTWALIVMLMVLAVALRSIQLSAGASLWFDELALALNIQDKSLGELATEPLDRKQVAPVGFLLLEKAVTEVLGVDEMALRIVPFACGLAALFLFAAVASRFVGGAALAYGLALFAISPTLVYMSGTVKQYSGDVMATLLLVWLTLRHLERPSQPARALGAGLVGALAVFLSGPAIPTAAGLGLLLLVLRRSRPEGPSLASTLALVLPWMLSVALASFLTLRLAEPATQQFMREFWSEGFPPSGLDVVPWFFRQLYGVVAYFLIFIVPSGPLAVVVLVPMVLALAGLIHLSRRHGPTTILVMLPTLVAIGCALADLLPLRTRVSLYAGWPILLAAMAGLEALRTSRARTLRVAAISLAALSAGLPALAVLGDSPPPYATEPMRPVLEELVPQIAKGDAVYVHHGARHALDFYGERVGLEGWTQGANHREDPRALLSEIDEFRGRARVWFVYSHVLPKYRELELVQGYCETIGTVAEVVQDPTGQGEAGAWLIDLSDPARLSRATVDEYPIEP